MNLELGHRSRPAGGGGAGVRMMEAGKGRKGTLDSRTPGADRDLGAGKEWKMGGNHTKEGSHRLAKGTPWSA